MHLDQEQQDEEEEFQKAAIRIQKRYRARRLGQRNQLSTVSQEEDGCEDARASSHYRRRYPRRSIGLQMKPCYWVKRTCPRIGEDPKLISTN